MALDVPVAGRLPKPAQERTSANGSRYPLAQVVVPTEGEGSVLASVICTMAIRGVGTRELRIPRNRYDPWLVLGAIAKTH